MKIRSIVGAASVSAGLVLTVGLAMGFAPQAAKPTVSSQSPQPQPAAGPETFSFDPVHSSAIFKIQHMGVSNFYGRFNDIEGTYTLNASNPATNAFDIHVKTESVDTKDKKRDGHLKSPDFFNAAEYPTIDFKSSKVTAAGNNKLSVTGDLTMHGVTKPVTAEVIIFPAKQTPQGYKSGFETSFTVKRTDFGMDTYVANGGLGDEVIIMFAGEGMKK